jgi:hypothetical protein
MIDKVVARDASLDNSPPMWAHWSDSVREGYEPADIGLQCQQAALNRFAARYRVARSFEGITLEGFAPRTVSGYASLFRLFLTWSAFEQYLKALQWKQADCTRLITRYVTSDVIAQIRTIDSQNRFYHLVISKANKDHVVELEKYLRKKPFNPSYLASSVRHVFAHGMLTPNANRATPDAVTQICDILSKAHLSATGDDFRRRVKLFLKLRR